MTAPAGDELRCPPADVACDAAEAQRFLRDHAIERALLARSRFGPSIAPDSFLRMLGDRSIVRYPTAIRFDAAGLEPGEFAFAMPCGEHPSEGFVLLVHPAFERRPHLWPLLAAYHLPSVNYGEIAAADDCEAFGAALFGLAAEAYYEILCAAADEVAPGAA